MILILQIPMETMQNFFEYTKNDDNTYTVALQLNITDVLKMEQNEENAVVEELLTDNDLFVD